MTKGICLLLAFLAPAAMYAQRSDREYVRKGNKLYKDSLYIKAEENYLKALDKNSGSLNADFNLGNTYIRQQKAKEAMAEFQKSATVLELEKEKIQNDPAVKEEDVREIRELTAQAYHNMGTLFHASQDYGKAVEAYKEALRNNPDDHETRYNLALAMHQLKQQQNQEQNQDQNQEQQQQEQQQNKDQQQNQDQQQEEQQQNQDQQQQQENENDMSKENAEQLLQAAMQDEKDVQERVREMMQVQPKGQLDKDW